MLEGVKADTLVAGGEGVEPPVGDAFPAACAPLLDSTTALDVCVASEDDILSLVDAISAAWGAVAEAEVPALLAFAWVEAGELGDRGTGGATEDAESTSGLALGETLWGASS